LQVVLKTSEAATVELVNSIGERWVSVNLTTACLVPTPAVENFTLMGLAVKFLPRAP
jgi:hypothetical protein